MVHDVLIIGATVAGLTTARRLGTEGFDVVVVDPSAPGASAAIGHGVAACAHASTVATMRGAYGAEAVAEHVARNLAGIAEIRRVLTTADLPLDEVDLHDRSLGAVLARDQADVLELLRSSGADVDQLPPAHGEQGLRSRALLVDPAVYADALRAQCIAAGVDVRHDVTVTRLARREGVSDLWLRGNVTWSTGLDRVSVRAVVDTLGISPWGQAARIGPAGYLPVVRFQPAEPLTVASLHAGPPVWLVRPDGDEALAFGPKATGATISAAEQALTGWVASQGGSVLVRARMAFDPSDHGRPVVGASAIPGGYYARGNGRGELMNGTASGCWLATVLLGADRGASDVALPPLSRARAVLRARLGR